ncbi:arginine/serine-rich splicing factor, putative [Pediculus humanus corporis]|uniref:Arginine/serine-rich splicing factor, putative n=2 Tax=Anoplura TaxID=30005 RepID=E0VLM6_PEDHC|nr:arginine/serine-rich splicing factor, putative [Pediculus humanus corporis]EEB14282.1 arginine/serine-rich splicing factor, putative [Pediculus humanus corporis]
MVGTRVYIGGLPYGVKDRDIERFFKGYGRIRDILIKNGYGFVEFDDYRDADDAVYELNGKDLLGERVSVERARGTPRGSDRWKDRDRYGRFGPPPRRRSRDRRDRDRDRDRYDRDRDRNQFLARRISLQNKYLAQAFQIPDIVDSCSSGLFCCLCHYKIVLMFLYFFVSREDRGRGSDRYGPPTRTEYRLIVENLSSRVSWQDLKDYMRQAGEVTYADAHKNRRNEGIVEFSSSSDLKAAIDKLDGTELNGRKIRLIEDKSRRRRSRSSSGSHSRSRSRSRYLLPGSVPLLLQENQVGVGGAGVADEAVVRNPNREVDPNPLPGRKVAIDLDPNPSENNRSKSRSRSQSKSPIKNNRSKSRSESKPKNGSVSKDRSRSHSGSKGKSKSRSRSPLKKDDNEKED